MKAAGRQRNSLVWQIATTGSGMLGRGGRGRRSLFRTLVDWVLGPVDIALLFCRPRPSSTAGQISLFFAAGCWLGVEYGRGLVMLLTAAGFLLLSMAGEVMVEIDSSAKNCIHERRLWPAERAGIPEWMVCWKRGESPISRKSYL